MTRPIFGVDREPGLYVRPEFVGGERMWCPWPPFAYSWSGPWWPSQGNLVGGLCPVPPERCEWDGCELPQDYEPGHHVYCTFHGEVWLHEAARDYERVLT